MALGSKKKYKNMEEFLADAKKQLAEIAEDGVKQTNWDEMEFMTDVRIADFVEQRFVGMNENFIQMEHDINAAERRIENMEDSPRKKAAKTILDLYRESYLEATDLAYMTKVYSHAQMMTLEEPYKSRVTKEIISQRNRQDSANMRQYLAKTEELSIFQNMMATFFMDNAIMQQTEEGQIDAAREKAQNDVLLKVSAKLPQGPEYDIYRSMEGYAEKKAEVLAPKAAELIMNSNVLTDVRVDNFPKRIRKENPKRLDIEWGVSTFDNMMDALYTKDELKAIKKDNKNFLETVFLDGKPALSVLPKQKEGVTKDAYMNRMKCEVVAYALEGKARMDVAPFVKTGDGYEYKNPIPMHVQVNLKEEVSVWKRFKSFLGIKPRETQKEIAERISLTEIGMEDHHREIKAYIQEKIETERNHQRMKKAVEKAQEAVDQADRDFFGEKAGVMGKVCMVKMSKETAQALEIPDKESSTIWNDPENVSVAMMKTLHREQSRVALCRLYAMTQGMTVEEVLSDDPALRARKKEIGNEFIEKISVLSEEEFMEQLSDDQKGKEADYKTYFRERQMEVGNTLESMMRCLGSQPFDFFRDASPERLAEDYQKGAFFTQVTQDLFQCCPQHVKALNYDEMEQLEVSMRCIGEMVHAANYCENYMADEVYADPRLGDLSGTRKVLNAAAERTAMDVFMDETKDVTSLMELKDITNHAWAKSMVMLKMDIYNELCDDPQMVAMSSRYAQTGKSSTVFFNKETREYTFGDPRTIAGLMKAEKTGNLKELMSFEEISKEDIMNSKENLKAKEAVKKEEKKLSKQPFKLRLK